MLFDLSDSLYVANAILWIFNEKSVGEVDAFLRIFDLFVRDFKLGDLDVCSKHGIFQFVSVVAGIRSLFKAGATFLSINS